MTKLDGLFLDHPVTNTVGRTTWATKCK